jgi:hypothetical protein
MSKASDASDSYSDRIWEGNHEYEVCPEEGFLAGARWLLEEARKIADADDYKSDTGFVDILKKFFEEEDTTE